MARAEHSGLSTGSIAHYFTESDISIGGSNFHDMCAQAVLTSEESIQCRACQGLGFKTKMDPDEMQRRYRQISRETNPDYLAELRAQLHRETVCGACKGRGCTTQKRADRAAAMDSMWTTVRCGTCKGCGETMPPTDAGAEREDRCLNCWGDTWIVPVTAKETQRGANNGTGGGESATDDPGDTYVANSPHKMADEDAIVRRGSVGRTLDGIRKREPVVGAGIAHYFGIDGDRWGAHKWGRVFALWQDTQAGVQLAKEGAARSKAGHGFLMKPLDLIASERDAEFRDPPSASKDPWRDRRRAMIALAERQARELLTRIEVAIAEAEAA